MVARLSISWYWLILQCFRNNCISFLKEISDTLRGVLTIDTHQGIQSARRSICHHRSLFTTLLPTNRLPGTQAVLFPAP
jgi:hypothetical protein